MGWATLLCRRSIDVLNGQVMLCYCVEDTQHILMANSYVVCLVSKCSCSHAPCLFKVKSNPVRSVCVHMYDSQVSKLPRLCFPFSSPFQK